MEWGDCVYALEGDLDADKLGADWMQLRRGLEGDNIGRGRRMAGSRGGI